MKTIKYSLIIFTVLTIITGILYPVTVWLVSLAFNNEASGSLYMTGTAVSGSRLIGEQFTNRIYFQCRPSSGGYAGDNSGGLNYGPNNTNLIGKVADEIERYRTFNGLSKTQRIPADAVTASASGLDPEISISNAMLQAQRIAEARGVTLQSIIESIDQCSSKPFLGLFGTKIVNVVELNRMLDNK